MLRLRATLTNEDGLEGVQFKPDPRGALAWAGRDLARLQQRIQAKSSTITGDNLRSYGPLCPTCDSFHFEDQPCRAFLEPVDRFGVHLGILDGDPRQVVIVADPDSSLTKLAGRLAEILTDVPVGVVFNIRLRKDGTARSDPEFACHSEALDWLQPLHKRLRKANQISA